MEATINLIKTRLENVLKGKVKSFYIGDPMLIPESAMPCISVSPNRSDFEILDNARDGRTHTINVALIIDARQFFDATPAKMVGTTFLMEIMQKEDADGTINDNTILGSLRSNLTLGTNRFITNISSVDYTTRRRTEDLVTLEAVATIEIEQISNRS